MTNKAVFNKKPFAAFQVCITLVMQGAEKYRQGVTEWMGVWKEGDHRDWKAIRSWAESLIPMI